jgi:hypothetical protein
MVHSISLERARGYGGIVGVVSDSVYSDARRVVLVGTTIIGTTHHDSQCRAD